MASINEILTSEAKTDHSIRLYPEGSLFYKAYERSAYLFVHHVRNYQVQCKYYKVCYGDVVSLGFPQKTLPSLGCQYVENADGTVTIPVDTEIDEQQFQQWKAHLPKAQETSVAEDEDVEDEVLYLLRHYNLAGSTPMETMLFVSDLQRMLNKGKGTNV